MKAIWSAALAACVSAATLGSQTVVSASSAGIVPSADSASAPDTSVKVSFGGFVDGYYAYDFGRPRDIDRPFTTQAVRHNEFNVNLAFFEARVTGTRVRGRLALQAGTSVQSNYSGEPTVGSVSGPELSRFIQEAVAGYAITPALWVDAGIFFSHIGEEGFISRDNLTYTRSLSADFTPYYQSGVKLTWQATPRLTALVTVVNGWQNISESNQEKGVGARIDYAPTSSITFSYYDFFGNEISSSLLRTFNGFGVRGNVTSSFAVQWNFDYGTQQRSAGGSAHWYSSGLIGKLLLNPSVGVSARGERYVDADNVIVATTIPGGFKATTASLGLDVSPLGNTRVLWRNELRGTWASTAIFPDRSATTGTSKNNGLIVTSLALTF
ncbi:MAG TPA: outer membrane beta-barrel protein [Gemmatimonadaceae bacterium]|nr:outer membrane beta-barrel protein [Gemmatimonadaceae bacterium]